MINKLNKKDYKPTKLCDYIMLMINLH